MYNSIIMKQFSLLIKPASSDCNSNCIYCFYRGLPLYKGRPTRMSFDVLSVLIKKYLATSQMQYIFSWQGGEPLLMGLDFYKGVINLQKNFAKPNSIIGNGIQTNGYLIDDETAEFFSQASFLVGISIDGPEELHNKFRIILDGSNAFNKVLSSIKILQKHNVEFNTLTVVTSAHTGKAKDVYRFLRDTGSYYHQYIPCVEYNKNGEKMPWTIEARQWGRFLCDIFEMWLGEQTKTSIRLFDSIINVLLGRQPGICQMEKNCCQYFVVEHNGDIFPCDFFVRDYTFLGNIMNDDWQIFLDSAKYKNFGAQKTMWHSDCNRCEYLKFCAGDCQKHRLPNHKYIRGKSVLCEGWKMFYKECLGEFKKIIKKQQVFFNQG